MSRGFGEDFSFRSRVSADTPYFIGVLNNDMSLTMPNLDVDDLIVYVQPIQSIRQCVEDVIMGSQTCILVNGKLLCQNNAVARSRQIMQEMSLPEGVTPASLASSEGHRCFLSRQGAVYCWGNNDAGQAGKPPETLMVSSPGLITGLGSGVSKISLGADYSCVIQNGAAKCWGSNSKQQLGIGATPDMTHTPTNVSGLSSGVTDISAGYEHACAVQAGLAICWGDSGAIGGRYTGNRLGRETTTSSGPPASVELRNPFGEAMDQVTSVAAGRHHTCALRTGGRPYCWGIGRYGEMGDDFINRVQRTDAMSPKGAWRAVSVSGMNSGYSSLVAGETHICGIRNEDVYCWGNGEDQTLFASDPDCQGCMGDGANENNRLPDSKVLLPAGFVPMKLISASTTRATCALSQDGDVRCWGMNNWNANNISSLATGEPNKSYHTPQDMYNTSHLLDVSNSLTPTTPSISSVCPTNGPIVRYNSTFFVAERDPVGLSDLNSPSNNELTVQAPDGFNGVGAGTTSSVTGPVSAVSGTATDLSFSFGPGEGAQINGLSTSHARWSQINFINLDVSQARTICATRESGILTFERTGGSNNFSVGGTLLIRGIAVNVGCNIVISQPGTASGEFVEGYVPGCVTVASPDIHIPQPQLAMRFRVRIP